MSATALLVASTAFSAYQSYQQGVAQKEMYRIQGIQAQLEGEKKEYEYTERARRTFLDVNARISANYTKAFSGGVVGNSGSTAFTNAYSMRMAGRDIAIDRTNAEMALLSGRTQSGIYNAAGDTAYQSGLLNAASTIVGGAYMYKQLGSTGLQSKTSDSGFSNIRNTPPSQGGLTIG